MFERILLKVFRLLLFYLNNQIKACFVRYYMKEISYYLKFHTKLGLIRLHSYSLHQWTKILQDFFLPNYETNPKRKFMTLTVNVWFPYLPSLQHQFQLKISVRHSCLSFLLDWGVWRIRIFLSFTLVCTLLHVLCLYQ